MKKTFVSVLGVPVEVCPQNLKIAVRKGTEEARAIEKLGFDPEELPPEDVKVFTAYVSHELDTDRVEEFIFALRGYAKALGGLVRSYLSEVKEGRKDKKALSREYAECMGVLLERLKRDLDRLSDYLSQLEEGEVRFESSM